jgi:hypothetical protein
MDKMVEIVQQRGLKSRVFALSNVRAHHQRWKERFPQVQMSRVGLNKEELITKEESLLSEALTALAEDQTHEISWFAVVGKMIDTAQKIGLKYRVFTTKNVSSHYYTWKERFPQIPTEGRLGDRNEEEILLSQSL